MDKEVEKRIEKGILTGRIVSIHKCQYPLCRGESSVFHKPELYRAEVNSERRKSQVHGDRDALL